MRIICSCKKLRPSLYHTIAYISWRLHHRLLGLVWGIWAGYVRSNHKPPAPSTLVHLHRFPFIFVLLYNVTFRSADMLTGVNHPPSSVGFGIQCCNPWTPTWETPHCVQPYTPAILWPPGFPLPLRSTQNYPCWFRGGSCKGCRYHFHFFRWWPVSARHVW